MPSQSNARRSRIETAAGSGVGAARVPVKIEATARDWRTKLNSMIKRVTEGAWVKAMEGSFEERRMMMRERDGSSHPF